MDIILQLSIILLLIVLIKVIMGVSAVLQKIYENVKKSRLLLEVSSPIFSSEGLGMLDQNVQYWKAKHLKYRNEDNDNKELSELVFDNYLNYRRLFEINKEQNLKVLNGKPFDKVEEEYQKEINDLEKNVEENEAKLKKLSKAINDELSKRDLDHEFLGKWTIETE